MSVTVSREGSVAFVTVNNPPVNAIGRAVRAGLMNALDEVESAVGLSLVVLSGAGRCFAAGADAKEFDAPLQGPHLPDIIARIEACDVPWVAAITGVALGGGCELALGCRYRIASPSAQIGLPEVTLGVIPGAGGTQRLPRLVGIKTALELIATGKAVSAGRAEEIGLIDGVADDPVEGAARLEIGMLEQVRSIASLPQPAANAKAVEAARALIRKKMPHQIAPESAIDLIEKSTHVSLSEGLAAERAAFLELREASQSSALRHVFFSERAARMPEPLRGQDAALEVITVAGGGTMGAGIAYALLNKGSEVTLLEADMDGVEKANANVEKIIAASVKRGLIDEGAAEACRQRLMVTTDYSAASQSTLAIEAAFESLAVKQSIFADLEMHLPKSAVLATNTSYLDVDALAAGVSDPSRVIGLHFFAPAHIMKLLEIVRGENTSDAALATGFALAKRLGKIPVVSGVCDGFIGNRILARYREAADTLLMEGSTPWEIDAAMTGFGYVMGPYEAQDLSGLDIAHANRRRQDAERDPERRYISIADRMVALGRLGRKTGVGWYRYPDSGGKVEDPIVVELAVEAARLAKVERKEYPADEIRERLLMAMINEAANILGESIARQASDIDLVTIHGYGFPRWRGGLLHYADRIGVDSVLNTLMRFEAEDRVAWRPGQVIVDCIGRGIALSEWRAAPFLK